MAATLATWQLRRLCPFLCLTGFCVTVSSAAMCVPLSVMHAVVGVIELALTPVVVYPTCNEEAKYLAAVGQ